MSPWVFGHKRQAVSLNFVGEAFVADVVVLLPSAHRRLAPRVLYLLRQLPQHLSPKSVSTSCSPDSVHARLVQVLGRFVHTPLLRKNSKKMASALHRPKLCNQSQRNLHTSRAAACRFCRAPSLASITESGSRTCRCKEFSPSSRRTQSHTSSWPPVHQTCSGQAGKQTQSPLNRRCCRK